MVGERRFELPTSWSRTRRATRLRYSPTLNTVKRKTPGARRQDTPNKIQELIWNVQPLKCGPYGALEGI